jgi:hypothetical protein
MRHMLGNLSPNYFERTKRYMMLRASRQGTDLTVSGTPPLSLPNSLGKPLKAWEVDVLPKQDLNGYDAPWPAGGGKNRLETTLNQTTESGVTYTPNADGTILLSGSVNGGYSQVVVGSISLDAGTYYIYSGVAITNVEFYISGVSGASAKSVAYNQFTIGTAVTNKNVYLYIPSGASVNNVTIKPMICLASASNPTVFAPYSNLCPIYGTDKLTITTAGKNLLPPFASKTVSGLTVTANADGSLTISGKATSSGAVIADAVTLVEPIPANTTVTFSTKNNVPVTLRILINPNGAGDIPANGNYISFTRPNVISGARLYLYTTVDDEYDFTIYPQLELGNTPSDYTPYLAPSQTVLTLPQTVYTGTIGSDGGESRWGEVDLGTLTWVYSSSVNAFVSNGIADIIKSRNSLCEIYSINYTSSTADTITDAQSGTLLINKGASTTGNYRTGALIIKDTRFTDAEQLTTAISGYKFIFELNTSTTFAVPSATIPTPKGTATTWATAEDGTVDGMEVTYVGKA